MSFTVNDDSINQMLAEIRDSATGDPTPSEPVPTVPIEPELEPAPTGTDPEPAPEPPVSDEPPVEPAPAVPDIPSAHTLTDQEYEQWTVYSQLDQRLRTDAEFAKRFQEVFGPAQPAPAQPVEPVPDYLQSDPAYQALQTKLDELNEVISRHDAIINKQQEIENQATMHRVKETFKSLHSLDDTQMDKVYKEAESFAGSLPQLAAQGVPLHDALSKIFESAYWTIPEFKEAEVQRVLAESQESQKRKSKAGSLSGSSGSVPRTATRPMNETEVRNAMIREFAEAAGQSPE